MSSVFIIYDRYMDYDLEKVTLGGVQTYITALSELLASMGLSIQIIQSAKRAGSVSLTHSTVHGLDTLKKKRKYRLNAFLDFCLQRRDDPRDIIIWASFYDAIPTNKIISISIQHGIAFDFLGNQGFLRKFAAATNTSLILKWWQRRSALNAIKRSAQTVCVDYNFPNWYRTYTPSNGHSKLSVIPNFTEIAPSRIPNEFRRIIFARRFTEPRGTKLAIAAARSLLQSYTDIKFTFAGEGPLQAEIAALADEFHERVHILKYDAKESIEIHSNHDIAIIPTLGSEGTSLSLLEAMAAGCAVICTNVGGMTNVVIDRFNGLIINPDTHELIDAIEKIYRNHSLGRQLSVNGYSTVETGFSRQIWNEKWESLILKMQLRSRIDLSS